jgi:hypothetical protein
MNAGSAQQENTNLPAGPLTAEHRRELDDARVRVRKIERASRVANVNGWTTAAIAALSLPFTLLFDRSVVGMLITVGLAVVAFNEFRGRRRLLAFDPAAATLLGRNQLGLLAMIAAYCVWSMTAGASSDSLLSGQLGNQAEVEEILGSTKDLEALAKTLTYAFYGLVIALSAVAQGLNAWYYFTRRKYVEAVKKETPAWALDLIRST